ncbi:MAG: flippase-like domain-containing protein [Muribaculaceae bacterium]|nr:flippase-like domain-containing protein [Muribaculaceae bacterium]
MDNNPERLLEETFEETLSPGREAIWKKWLGFAVRYLLPVAFTVLLLVYLFHKVDFEEMMAMLRKGVDYWWILLAMGISIFSHIFRAARWQLQLNALDVRPPFLALCCSIFGCYALNLVFPRLGEIWRCTYIASSKKNSFSVVLGSMIADRVADTIMVALLLVFSLIVAAPAIHVFLDKYPIGKDFIHLISQFWFWAAIAGSLILGGVVIYFLRNNPWMLKLKEMLVNVWKGIVVIARMKGKWAFLVYTLCIWGCYFVQLYVAFYAFDFTRSLCHEKGLAAGLTPCLVAFVLSSISMAVPSNGGLGPWNVAIMFALAIYGISDSEGTAFSMVQWSGQTIMLIILGIFTMAYISLGKGKKKVENEKLKVGLPKPSISK